LLASDSSIRLVWHESFSLEKRPEGRGAGLSKFPAGKDYSFN